MMPKEAIILCGGRGTRLADAIPGIPKVLAAVGGSPFLDHLILYLYQQGIRRFIMASGFQHELVETHVNAAYQNGLCNDTLFIFSRENEPLGTGGAIKKALDKTTDNEIFIVNGDSLFQLDLDEMYRFHLQHNADCSIALKPMKDFDRYGAVKISEEGRVRAFEEKIHLSSGLVNGGTYLINKKAFLGTGLGGAFSFEKNYLETHALIHKIMGMISNAYFIDIGIPGDLQKANKELILPVKI